MLGRLLRHTQQLPFQLKNAIEHEATIIGLSTLTKAASELSDKYRFRQSSDEKLITNEAHRIAYTATNAHLYIEN